MISYIKYDIIVRLMQVLEEGDIEIIDMWEEGDGDQDVTFVKRKLEKAFTNQDEEWQKQRQLRGCTTEAWIMSLPMKTSCAR